MYIATVIGVLGLSLQLILRKIILSYHANKNYNNNNQLHIELMMIFSKGQDKEN